MIRKMILPAVAAVMLAGCASYQYRSGAGGDYYYGQPGTAQGYYDSPYGSYGYGYPGGWSGSIGYSYGYYPYGGGYYPYYPSRPRYPRNDGHGGSHHGGHNGGRPGNSPDPGTSPGQHGDRPPSWRNLDALRERASAERQQHQPAVRDRAMAPPMERSAPARQSAPPQRPASMRQSAPSQRPMSGRSGGNRDGRRNPAR